MLKERCPLARGLAAAQVVLLMSDVSSAHNGGQAETSTLNALEAARRPDLAQVLRQRRRLVGGELLCGVGDDQQQRGALLGGQAALRRSKKTE